MFNLLARFRQPKTTVEIIRSLPFQPWHEDECRRIWQQWVPEMGQSNVLQGELLRAVEKLRYEALDNGNINWRDDHVRLCEFLKGTLTSEKAFTRQEKERFTVILDHLRDCGEYVRSFNEGDIPDEQADITRFPDEKDEKLYDILSDGVGKFAATYPEPIPRAIDPDLHI